MTTPKIWLITGAARGFGRRWAVAALERGDRVVATARDTSALDDLVERFGDAILPLRLDVTSRDDVFAVVEQGHRAFGRLDVVLSNAGYGHQGAVEEVSEAEARAQLDTNFFGTMWLAQAALPIFRAQSSGHLLAVSSVLGVSTVPSFGIYSASKFAVEGLFDVLAQEVASFGVNVTLIEPGGYATDFNNSSSAKQSVLNPAYDGVRDGLAVAFASYEFGDPDATSTAVLAVVDAEKPPLRLALGAGTIDQIEGTYRDRLATWDAWRDVSVAAQG